MFDIIAFLAAPTCIALMLGAISAHLGNHVLEREVIFVDLSIAQVAAMGFAVAMAFEFEHESFAGAVFATSFALLAAGFFAAIRKLEGLIHSEALIGVTYATASAATLLIVSSLGLDQDHIKNMLIGALLWSTWTDVLWAIALFAPISLVLWTFREHFHLVSTDTEAASQKGLSIGRWDFLFYGLFALVIAFAVQLAGVLLVFTYLVVPASIGRIISRDPTRRYLWALTISTTLTVVGLFVSFRLDLPEGATIVVLLGLTLFLTVTRQLWKTTATT